VVVPVDAPVPRPGDRGHDVEPVRSAVVARPAVPRATSVLHLDPELAGADLRTERDLAAVTGRTMPNGVGDQLGSDATRITSSANGQPCSSAASATRARLTWAASAGKVPV
jgi:hypothetical protein